MQDDRILGPRLSKQTILVSGDSQARKYVCIPERFVYGWIFSIRSDSEELWAYKEDCYEVLYNNFHKVVTRRAELYSEIAKANREISLCNDNLKDNEFFIRKKELEMRIMRLWKNVRSSANEEQSLFDDEHFV
jgi:hypothetical protein